LTGDPVSQRGQHYIEMSRRTASSAFDIVTMTAVSDATISLRYLPV
jgi:hypothetical protein